VETFVYPIPPAPRTAVLVPWFASGKLASGKLASGKPSSDKFSAGRFRTGLLATAPIRMFRDGWGPEAAAFAPAALAGTFEQLCSLDRQCLPSLTHALIVLGRPGADRLTEADRDRLWDTFRVPVFEQIIGKSGELLAAECEAHDGLHVESSRLPLANDYLDASPCPCGRKSPRIGGMQGAALLRRVAAYAR
jgi:hypothetical protein